MGSANFRRSGLYHRSFLKIPEIFWTAILQNNYYQAVPTRITKTVLLIFGFNKCIYFLAIHVIRGGSRRWKDNRYLQLESHSSLKSKNSIHLWVPGMRSVAEIPRKGFHQKTFFYFRKCLSQYALILCGRFF